MAKFDWKLDFMILEVFLNLMILRLYKRMGQELFLLRADYTTVKDWHYMLFGDLFAAFKFNSWRS